MYFLNYRPRKTLLLKSVKRAVSEHPSIANMLNAPNHCWKLDTNPSTFLLDHSNKNWVRKGLC